jgi:hypothetical protein
MKGKLAGEIIDNTDQLLMLCVYELDTDFKALVPWKDVNLFHQRLPDIAKFIRK